MTIEPSEKVEKVETPDYPLPRNSGGGSGGGLKSLLLPLIIAMGATFLAVMLFLKPVSNDTFNSNMKTIADQLASTKTSVDSLTKQVNSTTQDVNAVKISLGNYATQDRVNSLMTAAQANISNVQVDLKIVRDSLSRYAANDDVKALQAKLQTMTEQVNANASALKVLQSMPTITSFSPTNGGSGTSVTITGTNFSGATGVAFGGTPSQNFTINSATQITAVVGNGATGIITIATPNGSVASASIFTYTTSTGTTNTNGPVFVTLATNPFTGTQTINFAAITANTTASQQFSFQITNNTGKSITNIQLAVGLELLDSTNNVLASGFPMGTAVSLTSPATMTVWNSQSTGIPYILGFMNATPTGIFGGIGVLSQNTGTSSYAMTVTIATGANPIQPVTIIPIVKVVSYT